MKIRELLKDSRAWTQHAFARNRDNLPVPMLSPQAFKWSLVGALNYCYHAEPKKLDEVRDVLYAELEKQKCYDLLLVYNDRTGMTHEKILDLVTKLDV